MTDPALLDACPVCGTADVGLEYVGRTTRDPVDPATWPVWTCAACGHGFLNPLPSWADLGRYYSARYRSYDPNHGLDATVEEVAARARRAGSYRHVELGAGMRVLDVGCGGGSFVRVAGALGAQATGVEPSAIASDRASSHGLDIHNCTLQDFSDRHAGERQYDLITFSHVVEHLPDPVATLSIARDLLAPSGMLWIAVPNAACPFARRLRWRWHSTDLPVHVMQFTPSSLAEAASRAGLHPRRLYTYSLPKGVRGSLLLSLRYRWLIPRRLGMRLVSAARVSRTAGELDRSNSGEAIIGEFERDGAAPPS